MLALSIEGQSWAHRVPVGWKLGVVFALTLVVFPVRELPLLVVLLAGNLALYLSLGRVGFRNGISALRPLVWFAVIIAGYHAVIGDILAGAVIVAKMIGLVAAANFMTMTSRISDMMDWVMWALTPLTFLGVKVQRIALAFALVIRFTPTLSQRGKQLAEAWKARSKRRVGTRIVAPLAISALDDADHLAEALRARGGLQ